MENNHKHDELRAHIKEDLQNLYGVFDAYFQWKESLCKHIKKLLTLIMAENPDCCYYIDGCRIEEFSSIFCVELKHEPYSVSFENSKVCIIFIKPVMVTNSFLTLVKEEFGCDTVFASPCPDYKQGERYITVSWFLEKSW